MSEAFNYDYSALHTQLQLTQGDLAAAKAQIAEYVQRITNLQHAHARDIKLIGETLIEEANKRQWCSEYDEFVSRLNGRLTYDLPVREFEKEVILTYTVKVSFNVSATNDDDAVTAAQELAEEFLDNADEIDEYDYEDSDVKDA
jgi:hypothetical protein